MFIKAEPITPKIIGENLEAGPINWVKLIPIQDNAKSATANTKSKPPRICNTEKLSVFFAFINLNKDLNIYLTYFVLKNI